MLCVVLGKILVGVLCVWCGLIVFVWCLVKCLYLYLCFLLSLLVVGVSVLLKFLPLYFCAVSAHIYLVPGNLVTRGIVDLTLHPDS